MESSEVPPADDKFHIEKRVFYLPKLAEMVLQDAKTCYEERNTFSPEIYQQLNSIFLDRLIPALNILDRYIIFKYSVLSGERCVFKLVSRSEQFTLHEGVNYCTCQFFAANVLKTDDALMCEHVLALKLAQITGGIVHKVVSNAQMMNLLHNELYHHLGFKGFDLSQDERIGSLSENTSATAAN